ncbi:hypothetical protein [Halosolutus gelatinilyticus]|nr:hypothetical protein [Halosolutus gelatinilyticus]
MKPVTLRLLEDEETPAELDAESIADRSSVLRRLVRRGLVD